MANDERTCVMDDNGSTVCERIINIIIMSEIIVEGTRLVLVSIHSRISQIKKKKKKKTYANFGTKNWVI